MVTGIDDHSRDCVLAKVVTPASARQVCLAFAQALSTYGLPDEVLTDNGTQFTGRLLRPAPLARPSSSGSVGRTASSSASPRWPAPRRPARSSASTRPCARCSKSTGPSPTPRRPRPPSTPGGRTTTRTGRISPWTWPLPPAASCLVPTPSPTSCSPPELRVLHGAGVITPRRRTRALRARTQRRRRGSPCRRVLTGGSRLRQPLDRRAAGLDRTEVGRTERELLGRHSLGARLLGRPASENGAVASQHQLAAAPGR